MMFPRLGADRRGLTLIEMVLTLTILAVAGALVYGALSTALGSWRKGFQKGREELIARIVLDRVAEQLRSAVAAPSRTKENEDAVAFDARSDSLRFVTLLSAGGAPPVQVSYAIGEDEQGKRVLVYREYPWPDKEFFGTPKPRREEYLPEILGLKVTVTKRKSENENEGAASESVVDEEWKATDSQLPGTVAVEILAGPADGTQETFGMTVTLNVRGNQ